MPCMGRMESIKPELLMCRLRPSFWGPRGATSPRSIPGATTPWRGGCRREASRRVAAAAVCNKAGGTALLGELPEPSRAARSG